MKDFNIFRKLDNCYYIQRAGNMKLWFSIEGNWWRQMLVLLDAFRWRLVGNRKLDRLPICPRYHMQAHTFASFRKIARYQVVG